MKPRVGPPAIISTVDAAAPSARCPCSGVLLLLVLNLLGTKRDFGDADPKGGGDPLHRRPGWVASAGLNVRKPRGLHLSIESDRLLAEAPLSPKLANCAAERSLRSGRRTAGRHDGEPWPLRGPSTMYS
jgi:hypothetical protein